MHNREGDKQQKQNSSMNQALNPYAGYDIILQKNLVVPFVINQQQSQENEIYLRILTGKDKQIVFMELQSQEDLFFYYQYCLHPHELKNLNNNFNMQLQQLAEFVIMFQKFIQDLERHQKQMYFQMKNPNQLTLNITNQINHNVYLVLDMQFKKIPEQRSIQLAAYRYGKIRQEVYDIQNQIQQVKDVVKAKNPYLLKFMNKM